MGRKRKDQWVLVKVLGWWVAVGRWFGNCFRPALVLEWHGMRSRFVTSKGDVCHPAWATLTIRTSDFAETEVYWRGWHRVDFNSGHLALKFGKFQDTDFGGVWIYRGRFLGQHLHM